MKKLFLLSFCICSLISKNTLADCFSAHYVDCLKLYETNTSLQRGARTLHMSKEEYCSYLTDSLLQTIILIKDKNDNRKFTSS